MDVTLVQYDIAWEDKPASRARIEALLADHPPASGGLIVLPEMTETGFSFDLDAIADDTSLAWGADLARRSASWLLLGDAVRGPDGRGRNRATLIGPDGTVTGSYHKLFPFSFGREIEYFSGGDHLLVRRIGDALVGPSICYDLRFPELYRLLARAGAEVLPVIANWPAPRTHHWRALLIARAIENQAWVLGVNRTGSDPTLPYAGNSIVVAPDGEVVAEAGPETAVLQVTLDLERLRSWRSTFPALADMRADLLGSIPVDVEPGDPGRAG